MKRDTVLVILWPDHTRATGQSFLHLRLCTWATSEIGVTANRGEVCGTGSEIVVRNGWQRRSATAVIGSRAVSANTTQAVMTRARVERRCAGTGTTMDG